MFVRRKFSMELDVAELRHLRKKGVTLRTLARHGFLSGLLRSNPMLSMSIVVTTRRERERNPASEQLGLRGLPRKMRAADGGRPNP
jgi:hypothetical protein